MGVETKVFAGKNVPKGVTSWCLFDADNKRMMAPGGEGVDVSEFPLDALSVEAILATWGPGTYRLQWIGMRGGQRKPLGSRIIHVRAEAPAVVAPNAGPMVPAGSPLADALNLFGVIQAASQQQAQIIIGQTAAMVQAATAGAGGGGMKEILGFMMQQQAQQQQQFAALVRELRRENEDDDDEDEDGDDAPAGSGPFVAGQPIKDTAVAEGLNALVAALAELAPTAKAIVNAKLMSMAEEIAASKSANAHALNGSATTEAATG